ncbi:hypothetical protein [Streptomyces sp. NPDC001642]|uniref:hypothetical protein n=1 Tax=Streptomyces sp. NPDC001642 TaxID=3154392 RepID=UPI00332B2335
MAAGEMAQAKGEQAEGKVEKVVGGAVRNGSCKAETYAAVSRAARVSAPAVSAARRFGLGRRCQGCSSVLTMPSSLAWNVA